jgi:nucleotide-binding universal stress UspA family protein
MSATIPAAEAIPDRNERARFKHILCPIDFTRFAHHAVEYAAALAPHFQASITALHVLPMPPTHPVGAPDGPMPARTPEDLDHLKAQALKWLLESGVMSGEVVVVQGDPADEIVRLARSLPADLIVIASHGRTGSERMMLGSVTMNVLREAPCPILIVPASVSPARQEDSPFRRIACAIDFSPASIKALRCAAALAGETGAPLIAVHVKDPAAPQQPVAIGPAANEVNSHARTMWCHRLHEAVACEMPSSVDVVETVRFGAPADEILRVAEDEQCDLIVMGAHKGVPLGSTLNEVLRHSKCAVLTVRASR